MSFDVFTFLFHGQALSKRMAHLICKNHLLLLRLVMIYLSVEIFIYFFQKYSSFCITNFLNISEGFEECLYISYIFSGRDGGDDDSDW